MNGTEVPHRVGELHSMRLRLYQLSVTVMVLRITKRTGLKSLA